LAKKLIWDSENSDILIRIVQLPAPPNGNER